MQWRARSFVFEFPRPVLIMGILNVTPDSFSDGGRWQCVEAATQGALEMIQAGADLIDVGGESTRPRAKPLSEKEEILRVLPVITALAGRVRVPLSIDTMKPAVARAALEAGASVVNDVTASRDNPEMATLVADSGAGYVAMHMQGTPESMQDAPHYEDVIADVDQFFGNRLAWLSKSGVRSEQVVLDAGLGFGKTLEHNLKLLAGMGRFKRWGRPLLLGASRKSFIGQISGVTEPSARLAGSLACVCWAIQTGVHIVRVHDVAATRQALNMTGAILAEASKQHG